MDALMCIIFWFIMWERVSLKHSKIIMEWKMKPTHASKNR